jgi:Flp pilus assembly pilin Flp
MANERTCSSVEKQDRGATMVEYALMVTLLAIALIAAVVALKSSVSSSFSRAGSSLAS